jgi:uncharacterized lipoprotein YajG
MKKVMIALTAVTMFAACNNSGETKTTTTDSTVVKTDSTKVDTTTATTPEVKVK